MRYFQKISIEQFITSLMNEDKDTLRIMDSWNIERAEVINMLISYYRRVGVLYVLPMEFAKLIYEDIHYQLRYSPEIRGYVREIEEKIARAKAKSGRG
jgi:ABC-type phosphate transport system ATPase subunit